MTGYMPKFEFTGYVRTPEAGSPVHGIALCTMDGSQLEPIFVTRTADGGVSLSPDDRRDVPSVVQVLQGLLGIAKLRKVPRGQKEELGRMIRARILPMLKLEDLLLEGVEQSPRLDIVRYVPNAAGGDILGAAQFTFDDELVEPVIAHYVDREVHARALKDIDVPANFASEVGAWPFSVRLDDPRLTPEMHKEIRVFTRLAAIRKEPYG